MEMKRGVIKNNTVNGTQNQIGGTGDNFTRRDRFDLYWPAGTTGKITGGSNGNTYTVKPGAASYTGTPPATLSTYPTALMEPGRPDWQPNTSHGGDPYLDNMPNPLDASMIEAYPTGG
jgi:hypothetical protein